MKSGIKSFSTLELPVFLDTILNMTELPPSEKARGKRNYALFQAINTISFIILSGDFIILYLLKLGAGSSLVGIATSFKYLSFLFMFVGRALLPKTGTRRLMGVFWLLRYLFMCLALFSPVLTAAGRVREGIGLTLIALMGSQIARGVGLVGFKPVLGSITDERERGDFLSRLEIITYTMTITMGLIAAFFIGRDAPLVRYTLFLGGGIVMGIIAASVIFRFPDPPSQDAMAGTGVFKGIGNALKRSGFGYFIFVLFFSSFCIGATTPFIVVYVKEVYLQNDSTVLFLAVAGGAGAVVMGLLTRLVIDRLGAKPMFILFTVLFAFSIFPMIISPSLSPIPLLVFTAVVFFFIQMGYSGCQNAAQNYFFAVVEPAEHLNLGIFFNVISGIAGAAGALVGGFILQWLGTARGTGLGSFRIYWSAAFILAVITIFLLMRLKEVGQYSLLDSLSVLFSPRDMKAVSLLKRLDRSVSPGEEVKVIKALAASPSEVAVEDLLSKLKNPRYYIRSQALIAIEQLPFDERLEAALQAEIRNHEFTTAYMAARILGKKGSPRNRRVLRKALESEDYLLQANAAFALGRLGDTASIPVLEKLAALSTNPLVIILSTSALELMQSSSSLPFLIAAFRRENPPPFLRDELILAASGLLGMGEWFYPFYRVFLEKAGTGYMHLEDCLKTSPGTHPDTLDDVAHLIIPALTMNRTDFSLRAEKILSIYKERNLAPAETLDTLMEIVKDPTLMKFDRLTFLMAGFIVKKVIEG